MESPQNSTSGMGSLQNVRFESIDIQPEFRIPSPQPPLWLRCWQPIGTTVMDTRVLKEPRGFMRMLELLFAIVAFSTCVNFSTTSNYQVDCTDNKTVTVSHQISYPFSVDHQTPFNVTCGNVTRGCYPPGDFSSDAQFFVFTGVLSFILSIVALVVYVMLSGIYSDESKTGPLVDFCMTVIVAVFWLSASAAWANGVINLKNIADPASWIFLNTHADNTICSRNSDGSYINAAVRNCLILPEGRFAEANVSVIIGFLNFFLWTSNLWFIYKETSWFAGTSAPPQGGQQLPS